jgi:glycosyltransferase involved in cell wall biosynthesis
MRIAVHDYAGHPFQVQLSRELARRGHHILHLHFESFPTPKGGVRRRADDPDCLELEGIRFAGGFSKYGHFIRRRRQELRYGRIAARRIAVFRPDAVISANTPLDAQKIIQREAHRMGATFTFWLQDIYSSGIESCLHKRNFPLAAVLGAWYRRLERRMLRSSDAVIPISPDFSPVLARWGVDPARIHTIGNWAPLDELQPCQQDSLWSRSHSLAGKFVYLYAGTIGMKHDPRALLELAESTCHYPDVEVVVIAEGFGAEWLGQQASRRKLANLRILPLQPWEMMPEVLAAGSVLIALLDEAAGAFSVPSKVLSYLCAGRPILASVPPGNAAARIVRENSADLVVSPGDPPGFIAAAERLYRDPALRDRCAQNGLAFARSAFDIGLIANRFEDVMALANAPARASVAAEVVATVRAH